jgi:hypothetical protein
MATAINFSNWLSERDNNLAETIHNEGISKRAMGVLMRLGMVGPLLGAGGEALHTPSEKLHGTLHPNVVTVSASDNPGHGSRHQEPVDHDSGHGGHQDHGEHEHEGDPELGVLAHFVADDQMRKLKEILKRKLKMDPSDPNFKKRVLALANEFFGARILSFDQLFSIFKRFRQYGPMFRAWLIHTAKDTWHMMQEPPEEDPSQDFGHIYPKARGGYFPASNNLNQPAFPGGRVPSFKSARSVSPGFLRGRGHRG